jgi:branched-chain amino acid transport system substrate-binding protein
MDSRLLRVFAVFTIFAAVLGACAPAATEAPPEVAPTEAPAEAPTEAAPPPAEEIPIKFGILAPITGPAARTGQEILNAYKMAFEEIDNTIGPYKITLVPIDSQSDPEKATRAYEDAIVRDGIIAGAGGWHSSVAVAVMEVTAKHKVPHFFSAGETDVVNEKFQSDPDKYGYWVAKGWPTPKSLVSKNYFDGFNDLIAQGAWAPANKTIAIACEETDFGRAVAEPLAELMAGGGWEVIGPDYFPLEEVEFHPLLTKYKAADVAVTVVTDTATAGISAFTKQSKEVGVPGLLVMHGLGWVGEWYSLVGEASDGVLDQIPQLGTAEALQWAADFEAKWDMKPSPSAGGLAYDWAHYFINILTAVYEESGELTSEAIYTFGREKVWTGEFVYDTGIIMPMYKFTPESIPDPVVGKEAFIFPIIQYKGGEGKIIWPLDWAQAELVAP